MMPEELVVVKMSYVWRKSERLASLKIF